MRPAIGVVLLIGVLVPAAVGAQTTWIVDEVLDENDSACVLGDCSLREAIAGAAPGDSIQFALPGSPPWILRLDSSLGSLVVSTPIAIEGPGATLLTISGDSDGDGDGDLRVLDIAASGSLSLAYLSLSWGRAPSSGQRHGGCLRNAASATLLGVEFSNCEAWSGAAGQFTGASGGTGGAISNGAGATLSVTACSFQSNRAGGGATSPDGFSQGPAGGSGGAIANSGIASIIGSLFEGNHAGRGGFPYGVGGDGGAIANLAGGVLRLADSALVSNFSGDSKCDGGGTVRDGRGGGLYSAGEAVVENSTLSDNQIGDTVSCGSNQNARGGGVAVGGGTLRLRNATVASNRSNGQGGGIAREGGSLLTRNSLVADNVSSGTTHEDCSTTSAAALVSEGYNVVDVSTGCTASLVATGDLVDTGATPLVAPLGDHGGATPTHPLASGSPAIDAGDPTGCVGWDPVGGVDLPMVADQRGEPRPTDGDGDTVAACDAGAYEAAEFVPVFFDLDVALLGLGSGSVTSDEGLIDCPDDCTGTYLEGTEVELTAQAAPGSHFTGWSGDCAGTSTCQVVLDQARAVNATFEPDPTWLLEVSLVGDGTGSVASGEGLIQCPSDCEGTYADGSPVTLTATASPGSFFAGWSGDCAGTATTCMLTLSADRSATASFLLVELFSDGFELGDVCAWSLATGAPPCI